MFNREATAYWIPACAGMTSCGEATTCDNSIRDS
jgi:hypothetical protein